ncbi:polymeric immunoglobulin receptor-like, partial [Heptranchias perlo]|uniref:polymeric immunoglobulin receptor-like n=1 Tax=Heptranchias perlo TaxID=212740 RepID=UPI00355AC454
LTTSADLFFVNKTMRILILLICSLPVSGALWAKKNVNGVVGRAITIDCHYDKHTYRSYVKHLCHGWTSDCSVLVKTSEQDGQRGRMSITDNKREGIFVVTMNDLRSGDSGWYSCGIEQSGIDPRFNLWLQISYESVSVPVLRFLSPPSASCFGGSVSVSCESVQGSLPIRYTWYKKATSEDLTISESDKLDLQCSSFTQVHHQYYCRASNNNGGKSSEMVDVSVWNRSEKNCSYVARISSIVSGALWAKKNVNGVVGRAITIDCHYDKHTYRSYVKYWCHGWTVDCSILVKTSEQDGQRGRMSITDNKREGIFVVTMKDLRLGDSGWYSCGIERSGINPRFNLWLQISYESVSVPVLRFLSPSSASCFGGSVSVSCESVQGSLPIQYTWYKKATSKDLTISESDKLDLQCSSFTQVHHQYYCRASNNNGGKSSEMVDVSVWNRSEKNCSYVARISSIVSGALWAKKNVNGVVGRAITIDCHYDKHTYWSYVKYWCHGWTSSCSVLVKTSEQDGQRGRMSITDNKREGIFVVTMKALRSGDTGWYSCGIEQSGIDPRFNLRLQISYESVSVPVLRFLSPSSASCFGGSVSVSCESVQGSLPIQYTWYKKATSEDLTISESDKLDLQCSSFTQVHHQYYCRASNNNGGKSSEMVDVSVWNRSEKNCSYVARISSIGLVYECEVYSKVSPTTPCSTSKNINSTENRTTSSGSTSASKSYIVWSVLRWVLFALLVICTVSVTTCTRKTKLLNESDHHRSANVAR